MVDAVDTVGARHESSFQINDPIAPSPGINNSDSDSNSEFNSNDKSYKTNREDVKKSLEQHNKHQNLDYEITIQTSIDQNELNALITLRNYKKTNEQKIQNFPEQTTPYEGIKKAVEIEEYLSIERQQLST